MFTLDCQLSLRPGLLAEAGSARSTSTSNYSVYTANVHQPVWNCRLDTLSPPINQNFSKSAAMAAAKETEDSNISDSRMSSSISSNFQNNGDNMERVAVVVVVYTCIISGNYY